MAFEGLRKLFKSKLIGVNEDRIAVRTQGCWGCTHGGEDGYERAAKLWWEKARADILARGAGLAATSPFGEDDERVKAIRRNVPLTDVQIGQKQWVSCKVGKNPDGTPVADFVASTFLCGQWSGASGASIAREGKGPDKLPQELMEDFTDEGKLD